MSNPHDTPYSERLAAALERTGVTRRGLARSLAEHEGGSIETKRRNIYKWLDEGAEPEPLRAGLLAILLNAPELAAVRPARGSGRLEEVVGAIARLQDGLVEILDQLEELQEMRADFRPALIESHGKIHEKLDTLQASVEELRRPGQAPPRRSGGQ